MDQLDIAIHHTAHEAQGGLPALARSLGMGEQVLRNKTCPTTDTHKLSLREALAMMDATNDDRILQVLADLRGYTLSRNRQPASATIMAAVLSTDTAHGDIARAIQSALEDGVLTEREKANIADFVNKEQAALDELRITVVRSPNRVGEL